MATYLTNKERTNYARFCRVIIDLCTDVLRDNLNQQVHPGRVNSLVTKCPHLKFSGLRPNQRKLINDAAGVGSYKEFDITLLCQILRLLSVQDIRNTLEAQVQPTDVYKAVRNCPALITNLSSRELLTVQDAANSGSYNNCNDQLLCKLCKHLCPGPYATVHPSSLFWGDINMPDSTRTSLGDDIERIRLIRNSAYGHISTTVIQDKEFNKNWSILEMIMVRMDQRHPGKQYKQKLDSIKTMCMDEEAEKCYREELERLCKEEEEIQKEIAKIKQDMEGMTTDIVEIKEDVTGMRTDIVEIKEDVTGMRTDIVEIKEDVTGMTTAIVEIKEDVTGMATDIVEIKEDVTGMTTDIVEIKEDMTGMRTDIDEIKEENVNLKSKIDQVKGSMGKSENRLRTEMKTEASDLENKINQTENKLGEMKFERQREKQNTLKAIQDLKVSADDKEAIAMQRIKMVEEKISSEMDSKLENIGEKVYETVESKIAETEKRFEKKVEEAKDNVKDVVKQVVTDQEILLLHKQTLKRIEEHKNDKTFVATKAVDKGEDILAKKGMLMYSGLPGNGKTKNALEVMQRYHDLHPDCLFLELDNVQVWRRYINPDIDTVLLLDDVIGRTNTNHGLVNDGKEYWENIFACVKRGKLKVILTNRKNILLKGMTKLEEYEIFSASHRVDLTTPEYRLTAEDKNEILCHHLSNSGIVICSELKYFEENYTTADLLESTPIKLNKYTIREIIKADPVIGFPFSCHLFACNRKYTKLGSKFFKKPTQSLIDEINKLMDSESKYIEKIQYCIMSYMLLNHGKINLKGSDTCSEMFNKVIGSLQLPKKPSNRDTFEAAEKLNYSYIEKVNESEYVFKHQTILESVAICFYYDNPHLLLDLCNSEFIKEFIRPPTYRKSDGEVILTITPEEYRNVAQRFISNCTSGNRGCKWWMEHQLMDDEQFVDCFMNVVQDNENNMQSVERRVTGFGGIFRSACDSGKTYFIDRLYTMFQHVDTCTWICSVHIPCMRGYTDTVIWLLDQKLGMDSGLLMALQGAPTTTLTAMIQHPNITLEIIDMALDGLSRNCDCTTVAALLNRWPSLDKKLILRLFFNISYFGDFRAIDAIIEYRPDVITRESIQIAFLWACIGNGIETIEYLLKIQHPAIDTKTIHVLSNKEGLTNLHIAAFYGRFDVLKQLIDLGLSVSDRTKSGLNVLQMAILGYSCQGLGKTVQHFKAAWKYSDVMYGSDVAAVVRINYPTLANLCMKIQDRLNIFGIMGMNGVPDSLFYRQIIEYITTLTEIYNDLDTPVDSFGNKIVHYAVILNDISMITLLHEKNRDLIHSRNLESITCAHLAAYLGRCDVLKKLLALGLGLNDRTKQGHSVPQMALIGFSFHSTSLGSYVEQLSVSGQYVWYSHTIVGIYKGWMSSVLQFGHISEYELLLPVLIHHELFMPANFNSKINRLGVKLLHYCVLNNSQSIIELLNNGYPNVLALQTAIKPKTKCSNRKRYSPLELAVLLGRCEIFKLLYSMRTEENVLDTSISDELLARGRQQMGKRVSLRDTSIEDYVWFLLLPPSQLISFGSDEEYTSISNIIHHHSD